MWSTPTEEEQGVYDATKAMLLDLIDRVQPPTDEKNFTSIVKVSASGHGAFVSGCHFEAMYVSI